MRKIQVLTFLTLDGVMQAPGGPEEDTSGGFSYGGWVVPYFDEALGQLMGEQMSKTKALLLGRRTYEIFASYWPDHAADWPGIQEATKYVASTTLKKATWENSVLLNDNVVEEIRKIKQTEGPDIQVHGSGNLIQTLLNNDLVDELWLKIFPIILGSGKRLFENGVLPQAFSLTSTMTSPSGVVTATYTRAGEVKTGSFDGKAEA